MTLAIDIREACSVLPQLGHQDRHDLIKRILFELEDYSRTSLVAVSPDRRIWIDTLILTVRTTIDDIALMRTSELLNVLVEFERLLEMLGHSARLHGLPTTLH